MVRERERAASNGKGKEDRESNTAKKKYSEKRKKIERKKKGMDGRKQRVEELEREKSKRRVREGREGIERGEWRGLVIDTRTKWRMIEVSGCEGKRTHSLQREAK